ncbi:MAG: hypothetical protein DRI65_18125, partial [Chloroflexota bacterium]
MKKEFIEVPSTIQSINQRRYNEKSVYGINDANYMVAHNGARCPYYSKWVEILGRCYGESKKYPSYSDCSVCKEWLLF